MTRLTAILALSLLVIPAQGVLAQDEPTPEGERRGRGGFGGGQDGWIDGAMRFLTEELTLDAEQQEKVSEILRGSMRDMMRRMGEFWGRGGGEGDMMEGARKAFEDMRLELAGKISEVLTEAQKREFESLVDQFDRRAQQFEQSRRADAEPSELFNPKPISKRLLLAKAERSLFLGPDETAVILPFIERVIDARQALYEGRKVRRKDLRNAIDGGAAQDEVEGRLADIRAAEQFQHLELVAAMQALRELLTVEQEARFVAMEILE